MQIFFLNYSNKYYIFLRAVFFHNKFACNYFMIFKHNERKEETNMQHYVENQK